MHPQSTPPNAICKLCGNPFYARPSHLRAGQGMFCSIACRDNYKRKPEIIAQRFWSKVRVGADTECWEYQEGLSISGYGAFYIDGHSRPAHAIAWRLTYGPIPDGLFALHKCDNRPCCNPAHLFTGTKRDNALDMVSKGRNPDRRGVKHPLSKLTESDVQQIRLIYRNRELSQYKLGLKFGVSRTAIQAIVNGTNWPHVITPD